ncbi:hypothetical protein HZA40_00715 [Candidatus Peregrinibacteria bacterium]|nr:hypothetical protein [Candidatus Peregrinibacteria bacterium]
MDPILTTHEIRPPNFLTRLTLILFGVFATSLIFAITVKVFEIPGIWIGLIICAALITAIFYYKVPGTKLRIIAWSMLIALILGTVIYFAGLSYLKNSLEGFQTK